MAFVFLHREGWRERLCTTCEDPSLHRSSKCVQIACSIGFTITSEGCVFTHNYEEEEITGLAAKVVFLRGGVVMVIKNHHQWMMVVWWWMCVK